MKKKNTNIRFPIAKVKKLIQKNEEVGKLAHSIPFLMSKSLEYFLKRMLTELMEKFKDQKIKLTPAHLKALIHDNPKYTFLEEILEGVSDVEKTEGPKKKGAEKPKQIRKRPPKKKADSSSDEDEDDGDLLEEDDD